MEVWTIHSLTVEIVVPTRRTGFNCPTKCNIVNPLTPTVTTQGYSYMASCARLGYKPSFVIFDIRALWRWGLSAPECPNFKNYKWRLNSGSFTYTPPITPGSWVIAQYRSPWCFSKQSAWIRDLSNDINHTRKPSCRWQTRTTRSNVIIATLAEERLAISTKSIHRWKVHYFMGYNSVADSTGQSPFV